ncbi:dTDP-4-dehydrorhamnose reductase [Kyrpidia tusciae]|uniref:dTDP-4-dehydrorhamnose reductase n=1 Tax=Kyrpidia tusciae (strain DSM 2912 / NBRC 15312 / T2) TaxID=562970 RepID=D5WVY1_KYRT2|nr:dTDP-4-dehydrorhamnose reductase [Kyrpidia tusciae]ADG05613.1 dTDP-4-dehydrorhamnose reductase [Kyrpidia tusciae DSM 2912]
MKIIVTGANGQLGCDLIRVLETEATVVPFSHRDLDVADNDRVSQVIEDVRPEVVIHAAAYTRVDEAERDPDEAFRVNAIGARNVAAAAEAVGAKVVYVSTDYVFDGKKPSYSEFDTPSPINVYGRSKLAGEQMTALFNRRHFIVRTSWLYGRNGKNFVKTMLELARQGKPVRVVNDQIGSPTYTMDLARFIGRLISTNLFGTYHASNSGSCSWYEFAKAIFEEAGFSDVQVEPISSRELARAAARPAFSVLDHQAIRLNRLEDLRPWREALRDFVRHDLTEARKEG